MSNAIIAGYARTPFHFARKGKLASVRPDDLATIALRGFVTLYFANIPIAVRQR